jgi:hypothetical protein
MLYWGRKRLVLSLKTMSMDPASARGRVGEREIIDAIRGLPQALFYPVPARSSWERLVHRGSSSRASPSKMSKTGSKEIFEKLCCSRVPHNM